MVKKQEENNKEKTMKKKTRIRIYLRFCVRKHLKKK